jgi:ABC-2 type transport system permease protein
MTTADTTGGAAPRARIAARPAGFLRDLLTIAGRAVRAIPREKEILIPSLIVPLFFYAVNVGTLQEVAARTGMGNFKAFQLPTAIIFAVTGISRASALVTDIQSGYFDRLLVSPVRRLPLLLGLLAADFALVVGLTIPVLVLGFALGVRFESGPLGVLAFMLLAGLWGLAYNGFSYAIALRTGSAAAVNSSFILFFPFAFLTTSSLPQEALTGWLATIADYNPLTYVLAALRSLIGGGWVATDLLAGLAAIGAVGLLAQALALAALRSRVSRG